MAGRKVLVAFPDAMLEQVDSKARTEYRTRSELIREAVRRYLESSRKGELAVIPQYPASFGANFHE